MKFGKWLGAGLGWAGGGPIGALVGFALGYVFDSVSDDYEGAQGNPSQQGSRYRRSYRTTGPGDFGASLLVLSAAVMKADGKVMRSELDFVKSFLNQNFGAGNTAEMIKVLQNLLKQDIDVRGVCLEIRTNMAHELRLQLLHYLFGIAMADGKMDPAELATLQRIATYLGISSRHFQSLLAMFQSGGTKPTPTNAYKILDVPSSASDDEVKKAYRKMAIKHHPDKVASLGEEYQKAAKEKFQKVQEAWDAIKKERNIS